jgi:uncharacterized protein
MMRRLVGRRLKGMQAATVAILLAGCGMMQAQQAPASDMPSTDPVTSAITTAPPIGAGDAKWKQYVAAWRAEREKQVDAPDGWLSLIAIEWLKPGVTSVGAAADNKLRVNAKVPDHIGMITVSGKSGLSLMPQNQKTVQLLAPQGGFPPDLMIDGKPAKEGPLTVEGTPSVVTWNGMTMVVVNRSGRNVVTIKDTDAPTRANFKGLNWYAPDAKYRVRAVWTPYTPPRTVKIPTVMGTTLDRPSPGFVEFVLDGKPLNLEPVTEEGQDGTLFFILKDLTSQITTYATARYLHTGLPDHGLDQPGLLTLDFNLLENPPCAYTTYASCPLPPDQNQLPVALEAGEQLYTPN